MTSSWESGTKVTRIKIQRGSQEPLYIERRTEGTHVAVITGIGKDSIIQQLSRFIVAPDRWAVVKTIRRAQDQYLSVSTYEEWIYTAGGWQMVHLIEAYQSDVQKETRYFYHENRVVRKESPNGAYTRYEYDELGRVILEASPWSEGGEKIIRTSYGDWRFNDFRPFRVSESIALANAGETGVKEAEYHYEDADQVLRTVLIENGLTCTHSHYSITEYYGAAVSHLWSRGRLKMRQEISGIQYHYTYEDTSEHGAYIKETQETRFQGEVVPRQSTRSVQYFATNGKSVCAEIYAHTGNDWSLLSREHYEYDETQHLTKTTRANGRVSTTEWMCSGPLREVDEDGVLTSYSYNTAKQLVEVIRSETEFSPEIITSYAPDALGRSLQTRKDIGAMSTVESVSYDVFGHVRRSVDMLGRATSYYYSRGGLDVTKTLATGATLITERYLDGSISHEYGTGQEDLHYKTEIDRIWIFSSTLVPGNGARSIIRRDGFGRTLVQGTAYQGTSMLFVQALYNERGYLQAQAADSLAEVRYEYDLMGNQILYTRATSPAQLTKMSSFYECFPDGVYWTKKTEREIEAGKTLIVSESQLVSQLSPILESKSIRTDVHGNTYTQWTEYREGTLRQSYDQDPRSIYLAQSKIGDGFVFSSTDFSNITRTQSRHYTSTGIIFKSIDSRKNETQSHYDIAQRLTLYIDALGNKTSYTYDPLSVQLKSITNADGKTSNYRYDQRGRKIAEYGTAIQPSLYSYDDANRLISLTTFRVNDEEMSSDPSTRSDGDKTTWRYDPIAGAMLEKTDSKGGRTLYTYDWHLRIATERQARGILSSYSYDTELGNLIRISHSDQTKALQFTYNNWGQMLSVSDDRGLTNFKYNQYQELEHEETKPSDIPAYKLIANYDSYGRPSQYRLEYDAIEQLKTSQTYTAEGRLNQLTLQPQQGIQAPFQFHYHAGTELLQAISYPHGLQKENVYEPKRNLITDIYYKQAQQSLIQQSQSYDLLERPLQLKRTQQTQKEQQSFFYNPRNELIQVQKPQGNYLYAYDNIGNRKMMQNPNGGSTYTTNALNQYKEIISAGQAFAPEYDLDGNQTKILTKTGEWKVSYDAYKRPILFIQERAQLQIRFQYDIMGRQIRKTVTKRGVIIKHENYLYKAYLRIMGFNRLIGKGEPLYKIFWDPSEPIATKPLAIDIAGKLYYYAHDHSKNVTDLLDATGKIVAHYDYDPYGNVTATGELANLNPIQYSSEVYDPELGLVIYNYRHYNPLDGRWLTRDPIEEKGGINLYGFVGNNPLLWVDALGLRKEIITDKDKCSITIRVRINLTKHRSKFLPTTTEAALKDVRTRMMSQVQTVWCKAGLKKGCCSVQIEPIININQSPTNDPMLNTLEVATGSGRAFVINQSRIPFVWKFNTQKGREAIKKVSQKIGILSRRHSLMKVA